MKYYTIYKYYTNLNRECVNKLRDSTNLIVNRWNPKCGKIKNSCFMAKPGQETLYQLHHKIQVFQSGIMRYVKRLLYKILVIKLRIKN